jgi:hypothetical protein
MRFVRVGGMGGLIGRGRIISASGGLQRTSASGRAVRLDSVGSPDRRDSDGRRFGCAIGASARATSIRSALQVNCLVFDDILDYLPENRLDLLQIDAEGADGYILSLFPFDRFKPAIIHWGTGHCARLSGLPFRRRRCGGGAIALFRAGLAPPALDTPPELSR